MSVGEPPTLVTCVKKSLVFCVLSRLVDLAVFHEHISQRFNLTSNNTWMSFGGSYAGALSAWLRREVGRLKGTLEIF